jgi:GDPmannose 4,6-dehydratase
MPPRRALVTGITGQDGTYLAELLLEQGYAVHGTVRASGADLRANTAVTLHEADLLEPASLHAALAEARPDELYHLAAPTFVPSTWDDPAHTMAAIAGATATLLAAARDHHPHMRIFVATSSSVFGDAGECPQNERSPMRPADPYGAAKLAAHSLTGAMRSRHGVQATSAILFNHESPRRPPHFLSRKVTRAAAAIKLGLEDELILGDLDAVRDWSHAADVARAAWLTLQQDQADDYVIASGVGRTVRELVATAFAHVGLDPNRHVRVDESLVRPPEPTKPVGDPTKARQVLGWCAEIPFDAMIAEMVEADLALLAGNIARPCRADRASSPGDAGA